MQKRILYAIIFSEWELNLWLSIWDSNIQYLDIVDSYCKSRIKDVIM